MNMQTEQETPLETFSRYSVILVDDEPGILESLKRVFRREPYRFTCAASGAEGLRLVSETPEVAVILSDQRMPGMSGTRFLAGTRQVAPDAVRMLLTGHSDMESAISAMNEGGASRYLSKPWRDTELIQAVRDGVQQYHLIQERRRQRGAANRQNEALQERNSSLKDRIVSQTARIREQIGKMESLNRRLLANYDGIIESLAALIDIRSPYLKQHSANTAALSAGIATSLGMSRDEIKTIRTAGLLHDIGKNALPDVLLSGSDADFSYEDLVLYRRHPILGQTALDAIEDLRPVGILIRHHHERFDGTGFPDGLSGGAIPLGAAIIALADCFDVEMVRHVGSNAVERALAAIGTMSGTAFMPKLLPHLAGPAHALYDHRFEGHEELIELEIMPAKLTSGMVLTRDLFSRSGLLLLQAWTELDPDKILSLQRIFALDPKPGGIQVAIRRTP